MKHPQGTEASQTPLSHAYTDLLGRPLWLWLLGPDSHSRQEEWNDV